MTSAPRLVVLVGTVVLVLRAICVLPQGPKVGPEFQVNSYTTGHQRDAALARDSSGGFIVVWFSDVAFESSVRGQRYESKGNRLGVEFQVSSGAFGHEPAVATLPLGGFIVVWSGAPEIEAQRYDASGNAVGMQFEVNSFTTSYQVRPAVASHGADGFVVVWESGGSSETDTSYSSIQGQLYDAAANAVGEQFQINTYTTSPQNRAAVAGHPDGGFVVVWESSSFLSPPFFIGAQRYDEMGIPTGPEIQVNTYTTSIDRYPAVAFDSEGGFIVVWSSGYQGVSKIVGQRYDEFGGTLGDQFQINSHGTLLQKYPSVAVQADGVFVVAWHSDGSTGTDDSVYSIQAQRFDAAASAIGDQFQVNAYTTSSQTRPVLVTGPAGDFVVAWQSAGSNGTDDSGYSIQAQRYGVRVFKDGFESADTTAWSRVMP